VGKLLLRQFDSCLSKLLDLYYKLSDNRSMRYKSSIVVSVTLILGVFEYVAFKAAFDYKTFAWKLCSLPCFTLVVDIVP
jgi:hypothetical protein